MKSTNQHSSNLIKKYLPAIILVGVILVGIFFRFYRLSSLPPAIHPNEAAFGLNGLDLLQHHRLTLGSNLSNSGILFVILQAAVLAILKNSSWAVRVLPAGLSVITIYLVYLLGRELYGRRVGLIAAGLIAINPWVVTVSRDGLSAALTPFFVAASLLCAVRLVRSGKKIWAILTAIVLAAGCYVYPTFLALLPLFAVGALYLWLRQPQTAKLSRKKLLATVIMALVLLIPGAIVIGLHRQSLLQQSLDVTVLHPVHSGISPWRTVLNNTVDTALMYNVRGDSNYRHNLGGLPLLNTFVGIMFVLGLLFVITKLRRPANAVLLLGLLSLLVPVILANDAMPSALQAITTAPIVFVLAAVGVHYLLTRWYMTFPINGIARTVGLSLVLLLLLLSTYQGYKQYFVAWAQDPNTFTAYDSYLTDMGRYLSDKAGDNTYNSSTAYVVVNDVEALPIRYLTNQKISVTYLSLDDLRSLPLNRSPKLFLVPSDDQSRDKLDIIQAKYPNGQTVPHESNFDQSRLFYSYEL